ncbi:MAG TPA: hypothetical protein VIE68_11695 [Gemmatimonadota bacterium]|jgi:hypothetical protein
MPSRSIEAALAAAGLLAALAATRTTPSGSPGGPAAADTLSAPWIEAVTMEPIRVVVPRDELLEAVTMEPIRVVIPRAQSAVEDPKDPPRF